MAVQKDYKAIAGIIKTEFTRLDMTGHEQASGRGALTTIAFNIAEYFNSRNEWFNRDTFIRECGITN